MINKHSCALLLLVSLPALNIAGERTAKGDWPQFRGTRAAGVADGEKLPAAWEVENRTNILWKTAVPGLGHASPIVVGDSVFIVTAQSDDKDPQLRVGLYGDIASVPTEQSHTWRLHCLCKHCGQVLWSRSLHDGVPQIKRHTKASHANSTPASDGCHVVVSLGSEGLYCYDRCGRRLWKKDLGLLDSGYYVVPDAQWGFGSSPIIYKNMVIVQCDVQKGSFLAAFDVRSGRQLWRTAREDVPTWSTPTIFEGKTRTELVVNGYKHAGGYDPSTGKELWKLSGGGDIPVPTPVTGHGLVFLSSAHGRKRPLCAIREGAMGDITPKDDDEPGDDFAWYQPRSGIYMQTPIVYGDYLYACSDNGLLTCYEARTGERIYRERLSNGSTGFTASAVAGDGKLYFTGEDGNIYVVKAGPAFELVATNAMNEVCMATPAIADGRLIVRTESHVYAIGDPRPRRVSIESRSLTLGDKPCAQHRPICKCSKRRAWRMLCCFGRH